MSTRLGLLPAAVLAECFARLVARRPRAGRVGRRRRHFRPEFLNRIDDMIVSHRLTEDQIITIVDLMINRIEAQLANKDMAMEVTPAAKGLLARRGFDPVLGARPLRRTIQREIEDQLSRAADDKARLSFRGEPTPADPAGAVNELPDGCLPRVRRGRGRPAVSQ